MPSGAEIAVSRLSPVDPDEVPGKHGPAHPGKRLGRVLVELDAQTVMEVLGADGPVGTGSHVNEGPVIGADAVENLVPQIGSFLVLARQPGRKQEVSVLRTAGLVAPIAEGGPEHVIAPACRIQPDDPVRAESTLQHPGPETASRADVYDPATRPRNETPDQVDSFRARERSSEVMRCPVLDVGGQGPAGAPGPVTAQAAISDVAGTPQCGLDVLQERDGAAVLISSCKAGKPANRPLVHAPIGSMISLPWPRQACDDMWRALVSDMDPPITSSAATRFAIAGVRSSSGPNSGSGDGGRNASDGPTFALPAA